MMKKKYLIKNLTRSLFKKILEKSKNYLILKSFKNNINSIKKFKPIVICKFATPQIFNITKIHYLINLIIGTNVSEIKQYTKYLFLKSKITKTSQTNFFQNVYPLIIKNNNLLFNDYKIYINFIYLFEIFKIFIKINFIVVLAKSFIKFFKIIKI